MHRASRVLGATTSHLSHRSRCIPITPSALAPVQRCFAAVAIAPVEEFDQVASSAETTVRDGSKDKPDEEWQKMVEDGELTPQSYMVLRRKATEPGHAVRIANGGFDDLEEEGTYVCAGCGDPLFTSQMKFDCGCGWPGFWGVIPGSIYEETDADGYRVEVLCNGCNGHVGHVFRGEGFRNPGDTANYDERHCANSCSLAFIPAGSTEVRKCTYDGQVFGH